MYVRLESRDGDIAVDTKPGTEIAIDVGLENRDESFDVRIVHDAENEEFRIIVDDERVWSVLDTEVPG